MMLHIVFNLHDHRVILRLTALAACALAVLCFAAIEFHLLKRRLAKVGLIVLLVLSFVVIGYSLSALKGA